MGSVEDGNEEDGAGIRLVNRLGRKKVVPPHLPSISDDESISIADRIYSALRRALMIGSLQPGEPLTSRTIAETLDVSVSPVRDALKRLESEGALIAKEKSAFFVNEPGADEFLQILEVRLATECFAAEKAARLIGDEALDEIERLNREYEGLLLRGAGGSLVPNWNFHFAVYKCAENPVLQKTIESNWVRVGPTLHKFINSVGAPKLSTGSHRRLLRALRQRSPEQAREAIREDLENAAHAILPWLRRGVG